MGVKLGEAEVVGADCEVVVEETEEDTEEKDWIARAVAAEGTDEEPEEIAREVGAEGVAEEVSIGDKELEDAELARSAVVWMLGVSVVFGVKARAT